MKKQNKSPLKKNRVDEENCPKLLFFLTFKHFIKNTNLRKDTPLNHSSSHVFLCNSPMHVIVWLKTADVCVGFQLPTTLPRHVLAF